jgi:hypothetical protein
MHSTTLARAWSAVIRWLVAMTAVKPVLGKKTDRDPTQHNKSRAAKFSSLGKSKG